MPSDGIIIIIAVIVIILMLRNKWVNIVGRLSLRHSHPYEITSGIGYGRFLC
jgi:hypothetical protein